jgi:aryl-alcohol dehydrogenase-like predicted oxidoreductase
MAEQWEDWRERYIPRLLALLGMLRHEASKKSRLRTETVEERIDPLLSDSRKAESLSRKALWVLASTPGVTCVLNGMRTVRYVEDSTAVLGWKPLSDPERVYRAVDELTGL